MEEQSNETEKVEAILHDCANELQPILDDRDYDRKRVEAIFHGYITDLEKECQERV